MPKWEPLDVRFWRKVDKRGPDECWQWTASAFKTGYGAIGIGGHGVAKAHRVSFFLANGRWPEPFCCHTCDNRICVNPAHLFEGDAMANHRDMLNKGRGVNPPVFCGDAHHSRRNPERLARGSAHGMSKLSDSQVAAMRASYCGALGEKRSLAACFGVNATTVGDILNMKTRRQSSCGS